MNVEEIKSLKIVTTAVEVRSGKSLTVIDLCPNGKSTGRDIVIRNPDELDDLISALTATREWLKKEHNV